MVIFKGDFACLQAINLTNSTTALGILFLWMEQSFCQYGCLLDTWNTLVGNHGAKNIIISLVSRQAMGNVGKNFKIGNLMQIYGKVRSSLNISNDLIY